MAVVPTSFLRMKYRDKPIHPTLSKGEENKTLSIAKKEKPEEVDELSEELKQLRFRPAIMFPGHTQNKRVEKVMLSEDAEYRKETKPTLFERVELEKQFAKKRIRDAETDRRKEEQKEAVRQRLTEIHLRIAGKTAAAEEGLGSSEEEKKGDGGENEMDNNQTDSAVGMTPEEATLASLSENDLAMMDEDELADYRAMVLDLKEKRVLRTRKPFVYHRPVTTFQRRYLAMKLFLGIGQRDRDMTEVMPWLILGRVDATRNMYGLAKLGVTHILNCTDDCPNMFPMQFVYLQLCLKDSMEANAAQFFPQALDFFRRVEKKRGKIYVHCEAGASRAPTFVIAYLVVERGIALRDAYEYVQSRRPLLSINDHFLFQLAQLEIAQKKGSSVTNHRDWIFYEFNMLRADIDTKRQHRGLIETTLQIYRAREDEELI